MGPKEPDSIKQTKRIPVSSRAIVNQNDDSTDLSVADELVQRVPAPQKKYTKKANLTSRRKENYPLSAFLTTSTANRTKTPRVPQGDSVMQKLNEIKQEQEAGIKKLLK